MLPFSRKPNEVKKAGKFSHRRLIYESVYVKVDAVSQILGKKRQPKPQILLITEIGKNKCFSIIFS
jgi:hypothetical protein